MINKKTLLGKTPDELGMKDAVHVAIVAVRAKYPITPGARCKLNADREAITDNRGCGVADPFRKEVIQVGQSFWLLLDMDEVPNVQHVWQHPTIDFSPPTVEPRRSRELVKQAEAFGVTYEQLMTACALVVKTDEPAPYPGGKTADEVDEANDGDRYSLWSEWAGMTGYEFENVGTECCPEYQYPECALFELPASPAEPERGNG